MMQQQSSCHPSGCTCSGHLSNQTTAFWRNTLPGEITAPNRPGVNTTVVFIFLLPPTSVSCRSLTLFSCLSVTVSSPKPRLTLSLPSPLHAFLSLPACFSLLSPSICLFSACFSGLHSYPPPWPNPSPTTTAPISPQHLNPLCFLPTFHSPFPTLLFIT